MNSEASPFKVEPTPFRSSIEIPTSKSQANRALILAAVRKEPYTIQNLPGSSDVMTLLDCLEEIGLAVERKQNQVTISNSFPECEGDHTEEVILHTGDGGTTNRFLIPLLARGKRPYRLCPAGKIPERPIDELLTPLKEGGVLITFGDNFWLQVQGPFSPVSNILEVESSKTTQFASGLALAMSDKNVKVVPKNVKTSQKYFEMTEALIASPQSLFKTPVDFSSLGYPLALATVMGKVLVKNCHEVDRFQADSEIIEIIKNMGARVLFSEAGLEVESPSSGNLKPLDLDCHHFPDLVPTLCFLASYANGKSSLRNIAVLKYKECDRLAEMMKMLDAFGVKYDYSEKDDELSVFGPAETKEHVEYVPEPDHRMVMVAYLFMRANSGGLLHEGQHVKKSWPSFFEAMES